MITPRFTLDQTLTHLIILIHVPHIRVSLHSLEVVITDNDNDDHKSSKSNTVHFASPPYLLVLTFPDPYAFAPNADEECATYDPQAQNGTIRVSLKKQTDDYWENLHFVGRFLQTKSTTAMSHASPVSSPSPTCNWIHEVIDTTSTTTTAITETDSDPISPTPTHLPIEHEHDTGSQSGTASYLIESTPETVSKTNTKLSITPTIAATETSIKAAAAAAATEIETEEATATVVVRLYGYGFAHMFTDVLTSDWSRDDLAREMMEGWGFWRNNLCTHSNRFRPATAVNDHFAVEEEDDADSSSHGENDDGDDDDDHAKNDQTCRSQLRIERQAFERTQFSQERYLQDLDVSDDYVYQSAMALEPHWKSSIASSTNIYIPTSQFYTPDEVHQLATIPYPLLPLSTISLLDNNGNHCNGRNKGYAHSLVLGLFDLLFAYVYDHLTTLGDPSVESAWTIVILSPSLSWLDDSFEEENNNIHSIHSPVMFEEGIVQSMLVSSLRRVLIYPYLRNLAWGIHCARHVAAMFLEAAASLSATAIVVRCLLQMRSILRRSELYYLANKLYIDPYLAWIQHYASLPSCSCSSSTTTSSSSSLRLESLFQEFASRIVSCLDSTRVETWKALMCLNLTELESDYLLSAPDYPQKSKSDNEDEDYDEVKKEEEEDEGEESVSVTENDDSDGCDSDDSSTKASDDTEAQLSVIPSAAVSIRGPSHTTIMTSQTKPSEQSSPLFSCMEGMTNQINSLILTDNATLHDDITPQP